MRWRLAMGFGLGVLLFSQAALADRPFTERRVSISGQLGYGVYLDEDDYDLNPYGFGFGARAGYTLDPNIYIGGLFDFFLGDSDETTAGPFGGVEVSANSWLLQAEIGYDFGVTRAIVLRPKIGLGATTVNGEVCGSVTLFGQACDDRTDGEFAVGLGVEALFDLDAVYIAPEMRFNLGSDISALLFMVGIGAAF